MTPTANATVPSGVHPLDERTGGLESGGTYLVVGAPGPAKMVATLQFAHEGLQRDERVLLITNAAAVEILDVARAWGFSLDSAWEAGDLQIMGFRDDFELRAIRSIEPGEILEELDELIVGEPDRIAVDPGSMFLTGGARTLLGSTFITWARKKQGTVLATFSVDGDATSLPSAADWLLNATTGRLIIERRSGGLYQATLIKVLPGSDERDETVTLQLKAGEGLVAPDSYPARRGADRGDVDHNRLLLVSLDGSHASDLEAWAVKAFEADIVSEPFEAMARVQEESDHGCVLVHAPRRQVREAVQACRALRPLTRAAIVFVSDEAIRSTDRVHLLEAGADDCLTGGLDFRELGVRIKQSMSSGSRQVPDGNRGPAGTPRVAPPPGGRLPMDAFTNELARRRDEPDLAFFCVLHVTSGSLSHDEMADELAQMVRSDEGDLVSADADRCLALLQGAREGQLGPFLARLSARLNDVAGGSAAHEIAVLSHPADSKRIEALVRTPVGKVD